MALTRRPLHWTAVLVLFSTQGAQPQAQTAGGPTGSLPLFTPGLLDKGQNGRPGYHRGPTPGLHRATNAGCSSPRGAAPSRASPHPHTQSAVFQARDRGKEEPATPGPHSLSLRYSQIRAPRAR
ncbi:hypothetical protein NDU88_000719 [Pleurodeles waltl]|uniref:Uncharacterized protein n=1 Tax=Pleurodeles waltl TaxID=8319 RepID=A0AAV7N8S2_PLEWA|nr:hypothetical protein NDU88_000719 [Pleurodeles waltl]